eukprot:TRINITY_DN21070_c0_g1_i2.p1 TRINITY_DN21070_c0_g1~~TRINITY_DN21070_c0_g1_i2.p1  ORF type:complete len:310 (+),score=54.88 TRINITY_DN21070_c0_g1_i2:61-930(+)
MGNELGVCACIDRRSAAGELPLPREATTRGERLPSSDCVVLRCDRDCAAEDLLAHSDADVHPEALPLHGVAVAAILSELWSPQRLAANLAALRSPRLLVFLDVDGVLNTINDVPFTLRGAQLRRLAQLVNGVDAGIVLSSAWRLNSVLRERLCVHLFGAGLSPAVIVGQTPSIGRTARVKEITAWLFQQPVGNVGGWVVLDDLNLSGSALLRGRCVRVDDRYGFSDADAAEARSILERQRDCDSARALEQSGASTREACGSATVLANALVVGRALEATSLVCPATAVAF